MRAIARDNAPRLAMGLGLVLIGILVGLLVGRAWESTSPATGQALETASATAASGSSQSLPTVEPAPTSGGGSSPSSLTPSASPVSLPEPSLAPDAAAVVAIWRSLDRLNELGSYRFAVGFAGRSPVELDQPSGSSLGIRGMLKREPELAVDLLVGTQMVEFGGDAGISSTQRYVLIGDTIWQVRAGQSPSPTAAGNTLNDLNRVLPDGVAADLILPFAPAFERIGPEAHDGVAAVRYRLTDAGARRYETITRCAGTWTGDLWIADAGYLAAAELQCVMPAPSGGVDLGLHVTLEVTDPGDPSIVVEPPR
jgi:hypothetical protein